MRGRVFSILTEGQRVLAIDLVKYRRLGFHEPQRQILSADGQHELIVVDRNVRHRKQ